jgi:hypothetical protein
MNPAPDPLDRLFRSAAAARRAPVPDAVPFAVQARVLAALRRGPAGTDPWFAFLPLCRAGLAVAVSLALLAVLVGLRPVPEELDEPDFPNPVVELTYLP